MTNNSDIANHYDCPGEEVLRILSVKWVPNIYKVIQSGPVRFSSLLKDIQGSNKQSISVALHELEDYGLIEKKIIKKKPLHIEYNLSDKGKSVSNVFVELSKIAKFVSSKEK